MLEHYKQLTRQLNSLKTKRRYREKRERRAYLTEAYLDGELALYKPEHKPYKIYADSFRLKPPEIIPEFMKLNEAVEKATVATQELSGQMQPTKLNWFDKLLLFIRRIFRKNK